MKRLAIIPARGGSKRLPRKNLLPVEGRPMLAYPIACARRSGLFERVVVSTEDEEIRRLAEAEGAETDRRDPALADDRTGVVEVCRELLARLEAAGRLPDLFCCLYATAIFLEPGDLLASERRFHEPPQPEVVMGVSAFPLHPFKAMEPRDGYLRPVDPERVLRKGEECPRYLASNGTFYWARSRSFLERPSFYVERLAGHEIPYHRAIDIDTEEDLAFARLLARGMFRP